MTTSVSRDNDSDALGSVPQGRAGQLIPRRDRGFWGGPDRYGIEGIATKTSADTVDATNDAGLNGDFESASYTHEDSLSPQPHTIQPWLVVLSDRKVGLAILATIRATPSGLKFDELMEMPDSGYWDVSTIVAALARLVANRMLAVVGSDKFILTDYGSHVIEDIESDLGVSVHP